MTSRRQRSQLRDERAISQDYLALLVIDVCPRLGQLRDGFGVAMVPCYPEGGKCASGL
jgi:hypothetical protein